MRAAHRDPAAVRGRVSLLGEVGQDVRLVAGGDADQAAVFGGEQYLAVSEAPQEGELHASCDRVGLGVGGGALGHRNGVGMGEAQAEAFRTFGQTPQIGATMEQVVDEFAAFGLFLADREVLGAFVALGEGVDHLRDGGERTVGGSRGMAWPGRAGDGEVAVDQGAQAVARLGRLFTDRAPRAELVAVQTAPGPCHVVEGPVVSA